MIRTTIISFSSVMQLSYTVFKLLLSKALKLRDTYLAFVEANSSMQFHVLVKVLFVLECFGTHFTLVYGHSVMSIHVSGQFRFRYTLLSYSKTKTIFPKVRPKQYFPIS